MQICESMNAHKCDFIPKRVNIIERMTRTTLITHEISPSQLIALQAKPDCRPLATTIFLRQANKLNQTERSLLHYSTVGAALAMELLGGLNELLELH